jgi:hypothetical protein
MCGVVSAIALTAAGCGQSQSSPPSQLDAVCKRQATVLAAAGEPSNLTTAVHALAIVVPLEQSLVGALSSRPALAARVRGSIARATRTAAEIRQTDQRAMMTPLRTGVPDTRRAIADARELFRESCAATEP